MLKRFSIISGLTLLEAADFEEIVKWACSEIKRKIRNNIDEQSESARLNAAAAALAFYKYTLYKSSRDEADSFSAGDVSIKCSGKNILDRAYKIFEQEKANASDLLIDDEFLFSRTVCY